MTRGALQGKVVWITGASSGIGEALARHGAQVVLSVRREQELQRVARQLATPDQHMILPLDVANYSAFPDACEQIIGQKGRIDWLINNAGISQRALIYDTTEQTDRKLMEIGYFAPMALTRAVLPHMVR